MPRNTPAGSGIILPTNGTHSKKIMFSSFLGPSYPAGSLGPWYPYKLVLPVRAAAGAFGFGERSLGRNGGYSSFLVSGRIPRSLVSDRIPRSLVQNTPTRCGNVFPTRETHSWCFPNLSSALISESSPLISNLTCMPIQMDLWDSGTPLERSAAKNYANPRYSSGEISDFDLIGDQKHNEGNPQFCSPLIPLFPHLGAGDYGPGPIIPYTGP